MLCKPLHLKGRCAPGPPGDVADATISETNLWLSQLAPRPPSPCPAIKEVQAMLHRHRAEPSTQRVESCSASLANPMIRQNRNNETEGAPLLRSFPATPTYSGQEGHVVLPRHDESVHPRTSTASDVRGSRAGNRLARRRAMSLQSESETSNSSQRIEIWFVLLFP